MKVEPFDVAKTALQKGLTLLEASAGTGKTYTLVGIVLRLLLEQHVERLGEVLVVTYTVAATEELKNRLRAALLETLRACRGERVKEKLFADLGKQHGEAGGRVLARALAEIDDLAVSTIHGFCNRLLEEAAFECGTPFRSQFVEDEIAPAARAAEQALRAVLGEHGPILGAVCSASRIDPAHLVALFVPWRRHPDAGLLPESRPLAETLAGVEEALGRAAGVVAADTGLGATLQGLAFKANSQPWQLEAAEVFADHLRRLCTEQPVCAVPLLLSLDAEDLADMLLKDSKPRVADDRDGTFAACAVLARAVQAAALALRTHLLRATDAALAAGKRRDNAMSFQDLLERVRGALRDEDRGRLLVRAVQRRFRAALLDEFQDTDRLQYEIFRTCFRGRPLFMVGDPKQSIYGFRGADIHAYLEAQSHATERFTLQRNFRSHPGLVGAIDAVFRQSPLPFADPRIDLPKVTAARTAAVRGLGGEDRPALQWRFFGSEDGKRAGKDVTEPLVVADLCVEIVRLLSGGITKDGEPLQAADIAVLTRTNRQAVAVQDALRAAGVHSAIGKAGDIFDTDEMDEWQRVMAALIQPQNQGLVRAAWATRLWGRDAGTILGLAGDAAWERERERLEGWRRRWHRHGFVAMAEDLMLSLRARERLLQRPDGERRLTNFLQVIELVHGADTEHPLTPEGLLQWLRSERQHQNEIDYRLRELRLESDAEAVQILTVHGAKGLEYEVVFCPFLGDGRPFHGEQFLFRGADERMLLDLGSDGDERSGHEALANAERLAEDLRLLYVALTRGKRRCYVHWGPTWYAAQSSLAWLLHGPRDGQLSPATFAREGDKKNKAEAWLAELRAFAGKHSDCMAVGEVAAVAQPPSLAPPPPRRQLREVRPIPTHLPAASRILSFTALAQGTVEVEPAPEYGEPGAPTVALRQRLPGLDRGITGFARGTAPGRCLHAILERVDLGAPEDQATRTTVQQQLVHHGLAGAAAHPACADPEAAVLAMLGELAGAVVADAELRLGDLRPAQGRCEWQFALPVRDLQPRRLAKVFAATGHPAATGYADRLASLSPRVVDGFLIGFVDLVAEHGGRWFVLDWKSNHLGHDSADYEPGALTACMREHDYVLQYHLYCLALHRHLQQRLPDYDYDRHFGGVCYVFLRGLQQGTGAGLYFDRPPRALIDALADWAGSRGKTP